jgi:predicted dehydrogenase
MMIDFNRRFWPPYQRVADLVRAGKVGAVKSARFCLRVDPSKWSTVSDHRTQRGEGGALQDLGSQMLDLAIMVLGEAPLRLRTATVSTSEGERYWVELDFGSGAVAHCEFGYSGRGEESLRIEGERGVLRLDNPNFAVHHFRDTSVLAHVGRRGRDAAMLAYQGLFRSRSMLRYTVREALFCFLQAVTRGTRMSPGIEDALRVARWLSPVEAAIGSAGVGQVRAA